MNFFFDETGNLIVCTDIYLVAKILAAQISENLLKIAVFSFC